MKKIIRSFSEKNSININECEWFAYEIANNVFDKIISIKPVFRVVGNPTDISLKRLLLLKNKMLEDLTKNVKTRR